MSATGRIRVGTSGWSYRGWIGGFYPAKTTTKRMLAEYGDRLTTVEAHNTYRRRPREDTLVQWRDAVGGDFRFAVKAHVGITHQRDLDGVEDRVGDFFAALGPLGPSRGPVLFQLPHKAVDLERLDRLLVALPADSMAAFELGPEWNVPEVDRRLERADATAVFVDDEGTASSPRAVGPFSYVRLRRGIYDASALDAWADRLQQMAAGGRDLFAYVRHDDIGDAPAWAQTLKLAVAS